MDIINSPAPRPADAVAERLENNEIVTFTPCPFALPDAADRDYLFRQQVGGLTHQDIRLDLGSGELSGFAWQSAEQAERLRQILERFANSARGWLAELLPGYARGWRPDHASFLPEEEATRRLRLSARNDLLHVDASPSRPTEGDRILRLFVNIHPTEPRVWVTSETFAELLRRFGGELNRSANQWTSKLRQGLLQLFRQPGRRPSEYDAFMLHLQTFLKGHDEFQEQARKKFRHFAPGTAWLAFTDGFCHAELRGRFILEHAVFVNPRDLVLPEQAPIALWQGSRAQSAHAA